MVKCRNCGKYHEERETPFKTKKGCWADVDERNVVKVRKIEHPSREIDCGQFVPKKLKRERKKKSV
jgi:hypothetical protein